MAYRVTGSLRIRSSPTTASDINIVGRLDKDAIVSPLSIEGDWAKLGIGLYVSAGWLLNLDDTPSVPTPVPPAPVPVPPPAGWILPFTATQRGVHGSAGGWSPEAASVDLEMVRRNKVEIVFIAAYEPGQAQLAVMRFRSAGVKHFIIRAATHAAITSDASDFARRTVPILKEYAAVIGSSQNMLIAVHNEPNIVHEGFGTAWHSGGEFGGWFSQVCAIYRVELPGCKLGFPALSPGGAVSGWRGDEATFAREARAAMLSADWIGVHYYWTKPDGGDIAPMRSRWQQLYGGKPLVGTEVGPADDVKITPQAALKMYEWGAANNLPIMSWLLNPAGKQWEKAAWINNGVYL